MISDAPGFLGWIKSAVQSVWNGQSDDLSDVALNIAQVNDEPERRVITATVTRLEEGYRLIGKYYWPAELRPVRSDRRKEDLVSVGTNVRAKLERTDETVQWKVVEVEILDDDEDELDAEKDGDHRQLPKFHHIGTVVGKEGCDEMVSFYMGPHRSEVTVPVSMREVGYEVQAGDLLDVELEDRETELGYRVVSVKPLRKFDGAGYVDHWDIKRDRGVIDGHVTFEKSACVSGYRPWKNDSVIFNAVECAASSNNGFCSWRAVKIVREPENHTVCTELTQVVKGRRRRAADRAGTRFLMRKPKSYEVPASLWRCGGDGGDVLSQVPCLRDALDAANYAARFSALLHLEEMAEAEQVARHEMRGAALDRRGGYLALEVPGLAEMRPSLLMGDSALVQTSADGYATVFEGVIEEVRSSSILMLFDQRFHDCYGEELCNVRFKLSRGPFKKRHHAVEMAAKFLDSDFLFPSAPSLGLPQVALPPEVPTDAIKTVKLPGRILNVGSGGISSSAFVMPIVPLHPLLHVVPKKSGSAVGRVADKWTFSMKKEPSPVKNGLVLLKSKYPSYTPKMASKKPAERPDADVKRRLKWFNDRLNAEQRQAVIRVLKGEARPLPYVIFGPPGTGKTVTVVEAILQIFTFRSDARICVATPSNSSADLITERLMSHIPVGTMVRFNAAQRQEEGIPDVIRDYCLRNEDMDTAITVLRHRVVVATCNTVGSLLRLDLKEPPFTHAFLDEAGHMMEPEAMIPIGLTSSAVGGQIVLAGDPKQLGPVLQSALAKCHGLQESFLERLTNREPYRRDGRKFRDHCGYDPALVTMLKLNYRSHESIIKVSSDLFYHSELKAAADAEETGKFLGASFLPNPDIPVLFHGVKGEQCQEEDSPSWFNPVEAFQAVSYLQKVYELGGVDPDEVGIVTPYRKQVERIRRLVDALGLERVKVGTVEEFQGSERDVVIVSTVKSGEGSGLGFMSSDKRFNVAVTRAKSLLIVIGDPAVLCQEACWVAFAEYCCRNGCYTGCDIDRSSWHR